MIKYPSSNPKRRYENVRPVGWFETLEEAEKAIINNDGDVFECGYHNYAIVEETGFGFYPPTIKSTWYKLESPYDIQDKAVITKVDKPKELKNIIGWGLG